MSLTTSVLHDDGIALIVLDGELDLATCPSLDDAVDGALAEGCTQLLLDVGLLRFCDSTGLGALLRASRRATGAGGTCVVAGARNPVRKLFQITNLAAAMPVETEVQPALLHLRQDARR